MKVLFLHSNVQDYLADGLFHGLRSLLGKNCIDFPRYDIMYNTLSNELRKKLRGNGFTLYGLLPEIEELQVDRYNWQNQISSFDVIIIASIWKQWNDLWVYRDLFKNKKIVVLDGEDVPYLFPYNSYYSQFKKHPLFFLTPLQHTYYFKRELMDGYTSRSLNRLLGERKLIPLGTPANVFPISFSIPEEKITDEEMVPSQMFQTHIVDQEVAQMLKESKFSSTGSDLTFFQDEELYYGDLRASRFGITTKRAGWDCLRHYEIAAAGAVLCFKDLTSKPPICAPLGLNNTNCITYSSYEDLMGQIGKLSDDEYHRMKKELRRWIRKNTTVSIAAYVLNVTEGGNVFNKQEFALRQM